MKVLIIALSILFGVYTTLCAFMYFAQSRFIFFPAKKLTQTPTTIGLEYEDLHLKTPGGTTVHGWYIPVPSERKLVVFFHGNAGNISDRLQTIRILHDLGHSVLIMDYQGYGSSNGTPSESGTYTTALISWDYVTTTLGLEPTDIIIYGRSLGGAVAIWLAARRSPGGLIIESTFTRMADMGAHYYPYLPARFLTRVHYDSMSQIVKVRCPILAAHSKDDELIPFALGRKLSKATPQLAKFFTLRGEHNQAFLMGGHEYHEQIDKFIRNPTDD